MTKLEVLQQALTVRQEEVEAYQINIDNYTMAIDVIDAMLPAERAANEAFRKQLVDLLGSERREQGKAKIMLTVLEQQVAALQAQAGPV